MRSPSESKDDGLLVVGPGLGYRGFEVETPAPGDELPALFLPVHYEGYDEASLLKYQSSSGDRRGRDEALV